ncbi:MAG: hypothetical protein P1U56_19205 [Saprospiraceae bacterium]|nr:hypothetical protein [Saprospiraceae bacterium]
MSIISQKTGFQIRPRFEIYSKYEVEELKTIMKTALASEDAPCTGKVRFGYVSMYPNDEDKHYWSPHLSVTIEKDESGNGSILRGLYGPFPAVWTMFVFVYAIIALAIVIALVIGFANMSIDESSAILWAVPFLVLLFASMYYVSYFGQKKGHDQIEDIHHFFENCIGQKIE